MTTLTCPVCGHSVVDTTYEERQVSAMYGPPVSYMARVDTCPNCNESGDWESVNDRAINNAYLLSEFRSVTLMAEKLATEHNWSRPNIERVTGLQQGSIAKYEQGVYNPGVAVALRMACTHPPILAMLDNVRTQ